MRITRLRWALTLCVISVLTAQAQDPSPQTAPASQDAVIERLSNDVVFAADGTGSREQSARIRIQSQAALKQLGVLTFSYRNDVERVTSIEIQVQKPDGTKVVTPFSNAQDLPAEVTRSAPTYSDLREKQVPVKSLGVGDVLEFRSRIVATKADIPDHFFFEHNFERDTIVLEETLHISFPRNKYVKVSSPTSKPEILDQNGQTVYTWKSANRALPKPEDAPKRPQHPRPDVQLTTFRNWEEVGQWYDSLQKSKVEATETIRAKAAELTNGLKTNAEKQQAIYQYLSANFRYIAISFGQGRYQPHAAEEVLANQYGDCKDKHTLFAALLRAAGIEAWPALIGAEHAFDPEMPSPAQFNHVITYLPQGDSAVWLDATPEVTPYGMLQQPLRDHAALVIPASGAAKIMSTPSDLPFPSVDAIHIEGKLTTDGTLTAHFDFSERGDTEILMRSLFHETAPAQWSTLAQNFAAQMGYAGTVKDLDVDNPSNLDGPFHFSYNYERKNYSDWANRQFTPPLPPIFLLPYDDSAKPSEPLEFGVPGRLDYSSKLQLPAGYSVEIPVDVKITTDVADYTATQTVEDGILLSHRVVVIKTAKLKPSEWPQYQKFAKAVIGDEDQFVHLVRAGAATGTLMTRDVPEAQEFILKAYQALQNRDFNATQDALTQAERLNPQQSGLWAVRGALYGMQNQMDRAIDAFKKEIEYHPGIEGNYKVLVAIEQQARREDDAIETLRRWAKVAPESVEAVTQLTRLLLDAKKYNDAIEPIQTALKADPQNAQFGALLAETLSRAGQKTEALAAIAKLREQKLDPDILNSLSWALADSAIEPKLAREIGEESVAGFEDRLKAVTLANLDSDQLRAVSSLGAAWDTLGWAFFRLGDFNAAEKYVNASWILVQRAEVADHLGQIYERQGKKAEAIRAYRLALAVKEDMPETRNRLGNLGGSADDRPTLRRGTPSAKPSISAGEEVSQIRSVAVPQLKFRKGSAEFFLLFSAKKLEDGSFIRGDDELKGALEALKKLIYTMPFPDQGPEKIARRGILSCAESTTPTCNFVFLLPANTTN